MNFGRAVQHRQQRRQGRRRQPLDRPGAVERQPDRLFRQHRNDDPGQRQDNTIPLTFSVNAGNNTLLGSDFTSTAERSICTATTKPSASSTPTRPTSCPARPARSPTRPAARRHLPFATTRATPSFRARQPTRRATRSRWSSAGQTRSRSPTQRTTTRASRSCRATPLDPAQRTGRADGHQPGGRQLRHVEPGRLAVVRPGQPPPARLTCPSPCKAPRSTTRAGRARRWPAASRRGPGHGHAAREPEHHQRRRLQLQRRVRQSHDHHQQFGPPAAQRRVNFAGNNLGAGLPAGAAVLPYTTTWTCRATRFTTARTSTSPNVNGAATASTVTNTHPRRTGPS